MNPSTFLNANRTTTNSSGPSVYKGSAAVYRSLELPLSVGSSPFQKPNNIAVDKQPFNLATSKSTTLDGRVAWNVTAKEGPPALGLYPLSNHHFMFPMEQMKRVVEVISTSLEALLVDVTLYENYEWSCSRCDEESFKETIFLVRVFDTGAVDLQRESGCPFVLNALFDDLRERCLGARNDKPSGSLRAGRFIPMALPKELEEEKKDDDQSLSPLLSLMQSPEVEVQREGLFLLNRLGVKGNMCYPIPQFLTKIFADSKDGCVRRLAATAQSKCREVDSLSNEDVKVWVTVVRNDQETLEIRRYAAKALSRLEPNKLRDYVQMLNSVNCSDPRLRNVISNLQRMIAA